MGLFLRSVVCAARRTTPLWSKLALLSQTRSQHRAAGSRTSGEEASGCAAGRAAGRVVGSAVGGAACRFRLSKERGWQLAARSFGSAAVFCQHSEALFPDRDVMGTPTR